MSRCRSPPRSCRSASAAPSRGRSGAARHDADAAGRLAPPAAAAPPSGWRRRGRHYRPPPVTCCTPGR
eukprot:1093934-Pyramimonas_sp.AAC.1